MSNKKRKGTRRRDNRERRISVRAVRRDEPDARKLARAVIELAMAQAEAEAQSEADARADQETTQLSEGDEPDAQSSS